MSLIPDSRVRREPQLTLCSRTDEHGRPERHDPQERLQIARSGAEAAERGGRARSTPSAASRGSRAGRRRASPAAASAGGPRARSRSSRTASPARRVRSLSVTAKRPRASRVPGRPTATCTRRTTFAAAPTVSRRAERSTCSDTSTAPGRVAAARIQPGRPFGRSGTTHPQPAAALGAARRRPWASRTRCAASAGRRGARRARRAARSPAGRGRSPSGRAAARASLGALARDREVGRGRRLRGLARGCAAAAGERRRAAARAARFTVSGSIPDRRARNCGPAGGARSAPRAAA